MKMMKFKVAGVSYYKDNILELADENDDYLLLSNRELIESYDIGDKIYQYEFNPKHVELIPDPENEYDKNAVRVEIDGLQVGHIKKGSCSQVKNLLASPDFLRVEVDSMGLGGYKRICEEYEEDEYDWYSEKGPKRKVYVEKGEYESCWVHILICMREPEDVNAPVVSPLENKAEPGAKSSEFNEREKGEKKLEKWHIIVIAAVLALAGALLIVYGVMPSESAPSNTAPQTESTSQVSSEAESTAEEETAEAEEESTEPETAEAEEESTEPETAETEEESAEPETAEAEEESAEPETAEAEEESAEPEPAEADEPLSVERRSALEKAENYLTLTAFSHDGLIKQLEFEKFSHDDAVYAADHCGADWNEQAAKKAKDYRELTSFSHAGLVDQLKFDGFTAEQAEYGASQTE